MDEILDASASDVEVFEAAVLVWKRAEEAPKQLTHSGVEFYRFMDRFFVREAELDQLSLPDVISLCRAREKYSDSIGAANEAVKNVLRMFVAQTTPNRVVEIGAGARPLFNGDTKVFEYLALDADLESMAQVSARKDKFCSQTSNTSIEDASVDLIVAVFVFQFRIYDSQLDEIARILAPEGLLLFNVYRRTEQSKRRLVADLERRGLSVARLSDPHNVCQDHEYWLAVRHREQSTRYRQVLEGCISS